VVKIMLMLLCISSSPFVYAECQKNRVKVQVLGSGGPELSDNRASTSYLIWLDNRGVILVDTGSGSALNYEKSGAKLNDLEFIVFSHLHVDHSVDFPAYIKAFYFSRRNKDIHVFGPAGNRQMPGITEFVNGLFGNKGIYRYLNEYVNANQDSRYHILAKNVTINNRHLQKVYQNTELSLFAIPVHHGPLPAVAWRINIAGCALTFSGDMSNHFKTLVNLAKGSDLLVAHNAISEGMQGSGRRLHMPPSEIGKIAHQAGIRKLILSHRMQRTLGKEKQTLDIIKQYYQGTVVFADDLDVFSVGVN